MRHSFFFGCALACGFSLTLAAQTPALDERVQKLEIALEELKAKPAAAAVPTALSLLKDPRQTRTQLGPVASKIYFQPDQAWSLGLSGELFSYRAGDQRRANVMTVAPVLSFRPHRRVVFNSQFLFENGGSESRDTIAYQKGQSIVQMAYLDWLFNDQGDSGLRVGHQLVPVGMINTRNEPVAYFSVLKPELEREFIPASWHENGVSLWIDRPGADIQIGVFNSLDARGFRHETFMAGGRSQGQNAAAENLMGVLRVNAKHEWLLIGASFAAGNTAQNVPALRNAGFRLGEVHVSAHWPRFELNAMGVRAQFDDADAITIYNASAMPAAAQGLAFEAAYDLLGGRRQLWAFVRQSNYNLNARMPAGAIADRALDKEVWVYGLNYRPLPNVTVKADYAEKVTAASAKPEGELSLGLGVVF